MIARTSRSAAEYLLRGLPDHQVLTVLDVASLLPGKRRGTRINSRVVERWIRRGLRGHRLRSCRLGSRYLVRVADLRTFLDAIAAPDRPPSRGERRREERRSAERNDRVVNALEALGL